MITQWGFPAALAAALVACSRDTSNGPPATAESTPASARPPTADVVAVDAVPDGDRVRFAVTVRSDDTGCERYADWWEVVSLEGELLQRRILTHSHVDEQPFERAAPPIDLDLDQEVLVRAHLHPQGYVGQGMQGSVSGGWRAVPGDALAPELAQAEPLPDGCRF